MAFGFAIWILVLLVAVLVPAVLRARAEQPAPGPDIEVDGLTWRLHHVRPGRDDSLASWLAVFAIASSPPLLFVGWLLWTGGGPSLPTLLLLLGAPLAFLGAILWFTAILAGARSDLSASPQGMVWRRRWPLRSRAWDWYELRSITPGEDALVLETGRGEQVRIPLPGVWWADLDAVASALEATRALAQPPPDALPQLPAALRELQRRAPEPP